VAYLLDDASTEYLSVDTAAATAEPMTLVAMVKSNDLTILQTVIYIGDKDTTNQNLFQLVLRGDQAGDFVRATQFGAGSVANAITSLAYSTSAWNSMVAAFIASNSRAAYIDGGNKGTDTTARTTSGVDKTTIGAGIASGSPGGPLSGEIAEGAVYSANIGDDGALMLSKGFSPLCVKLASLASYWPMYGNMSPEIDLVGGLSLTLNNTPTKSAHPRVFTPRRR